MGRFLGWKIFLALTLLWGSWGGSPESWAGSAISGRLAPEIAEMPSFLGQICKIVGILGLLLGLFVLILYLLRRPLRSKGRPGSSRLIQVLATHYLEPKKALILVEIAGQRLLLASVAENLTLLTPLVSNSRAWENLPREERESVLPGSGKDTLLLSSKKRPLCTSLPRKNNGS